MQSGAVCFRTNNIGCARRYFSSMSDKNSAIGALLLAHTYNPNFMEKLNSKDIKTDTKRAGELYKRAIQLGNVEAKKYLKNL